MIHKQLNEQLNQLAGLLKTITPEQYCYKSKFLSNASIGSHTRHIIELLQCLINGYETELIDYINRERNLQIETNVELALYLIEVLKMQSDLSDKIVYIVSEDATTVYSSYSRELVYNIEHIIHHLALIKVSLIELGLDIVNENFGMAYATIEYKKICSRQANMCTVTYIPFKTGAILTSNRDENIARGNAVLPQKIYNNNITSIYPADAQSSGTWVGCNEKNTVAILLNGAFKNHQKKKLYANSRGIIIPTILHSNNELLTAETFNYTGFEPFTLILYTNNSLYEFRWDEYSLHKKELNNTEIYLWNSATLYTENIEQNNFKDLQNITLKSFTEKDILALHQSKKYEMQLAKDSLKNNIKTISISQVIASENTICFHYYDLLQPQESTINLPSNLIKEFLINEA